MGRHLIADYPAPGRQGSAIRWGLICGRWASMIICTLIAGLMFPFFAPANLIMEYLVGVVVVASRYGRGPSILASGLSVVAFDFFFIPDR
ncbi:MAG: DUF4118 domain-containing protein [Anaerolineaceae bacterium]|nr:DUF4118 domain-containing protein [Anaerolineaceae bacterium]